MSLSPMSKTETPVWFSQLLAEGFEPYVITSTHLLPSLNLSPFGVRAKTFLMQEPKDKPFMDAYLTGNFLSFGSADEDYKMPRWVYVDCVMLPNAVVGFMAPKAMGSGDLLGLFEKDLEGSAISRGAYEATPVLPVSGQIDTLANDGSFVNFSLFSLGRRFNGTKRLGVYTKALSAEVRGIRGNGKPYRIICQYDNPSMKVHGHLSSSFEIEQAVVKHHPGDHMTLVAKMLVDYDPHRLDHSKDPIEPTFWLAAKDETTKLQMQEKIQSGYRYEIVPPYTEKRNDAVFLAIREHAPKP